MQTYITEHYVFIYTEKTLAANDIEKIATEQEECFNKICSMLKVNFTEKIKYYLLESPEEVGKLYGINEPINGFAVWGENKIYAVYNDTIKCIGPHEDAHLISFVVNAPKSNFIVEGLAMYFDEKWWGLDNDICAVYYKDCDKNLSVSKLLSNDEFDSLDCEVTYPIAGSFTKYLITTFGINRYLELYKISEELKSNHFEMIFNHTIEELESYFWKKISEIDYDLKNVRSILGK